MGLLGDSGGGKAPGDQVGSVLDRLISSILICLGERGRNERTIALYSSKIRARKAIFNGQLPSSV
ncbi:hypothetical protein O9992_12190 [Vibrio lentus]|nr:hypothetical protein [Vibrio lentus]